VAAKNLICFGMSTLLKKQLPISPDMNSLVLHCRQDMKVFSDMWSAAMSNSIASLFKRAALGLTLATLLTGLPQCTRHLAGPLILQESYISDKLGGANGILSVTDSPDAGDGNNNFHILFNSGFRWKHSVTTVSTTDQPWSLSEPIELNPLFYQGSILYDSQSDPAATLVWMRSGDPDDFLDIDHGDTWSSLLSAGSPPHIFQTCFAPAAFWFNGERYVIWWNRFQESVLSVARNAPEHELSDFNTIDWISASAGDGCNGHSNFKTGCLPTQWCRPSVTRFNGSVYVLTACYVPEVCSLTEPVSDQKSSQGFVRISRNVSQNIASFWANNSLSLGKKHLSGDPVIQAFKNKLYVFFMSSANGVRTISYKFSDDGNHWSETFELPMDESLAEAARELGGDPGVWGQQFDVTIIGNNLAVIVVSGIGSVENLRHIVISVYQ
jgi:hypothetical protein